MTSRALKIISLSLLLSTCSLWAGKIADDFSAWTLLKTEQVDKNHPLFPAFGPIRYQIYTDIPSSERSRFAMVVYPVDPDPANPDRRLLVGLIEQQMVSGKEVWRVSASDGEGKSLSDDEVKDACLSCHTRTDRGILLGQYQ